MPKLSRKSLVQSRRSYAILIGINKYAKINASPLTPVPDATRLSEVLRDRQGFAGEDNIQQIRNRTIISFRFWGGYCFRWLGAAIEHSRSYVNEPQRRQREEDPAKIGKLLSAGS